LRGLAVAWERAPVASKDKDEATAQTRCGTADGRIRA